MSDNFSLTLEQNAEDSILHAFEHLAGYERASDLKFAVQHAIHGLELIVKAYLAKQHHLLIYSKPENGEKSYTVDLDTALGRAMQCGLTLDKSSLLIIAKVKGYRNQIEHSQFDLEKIEVERALMSALEVILEIMDSEFDKSREDLVRDSDWLQVLENLKSFEDRVDEAERIARDKLPDPRDGDSGEVLQCDECLAEAVPVPSGEKAQCCNCGVLHHYFSCRNCGGYILGEADETETCRECLINIFNRED